MIILETERLILRTWKTGDIEKLAAISADPVVMRYFPSTQDFTYTEKLITRFMEDYQNSGFTLYAVEIKKSGEFIGFVGLDPTSFEAHFTPAIEIGWRLASQHWNKGYATEAAKVVLKHAFINLGLTEIVSFTAVDNKQSRRVMKKIGMHHDPKDDFDHPKLDKTSPY